MKKNIVIGAAWTYANSDIHLGHICAYIGGDVLARYYRAKGDNVCFVSGTDCHGTPTTERAIRENTTPEKIVNRYHEQYVEVFKKLGMSYDLYTKTADPYHHQKVQEMFLELQKNGYLYPKTEEASFCPHCNKFIYDREVEVICPKCGAMSKGDQCGSCDYVFQAQDLLKGKCRICGGQTEVRENTNLYFKLSTLEEPLKKHFEDCKKYWRKNTINETEKFLKEGLVDRAVTRDLNWGIKIPLPGYDDKRIYVWFEAVWGYVTAVQKYCEEHNLDWRDYWYKHGEGQNKIYMCHGKDNIVFHTIIFPALLLAVSPKFCLPEVCASVEFLNSNGEKMSKSKGNGLPMLDMLAKYNPDSIRYFAIGNGPEKRDSNFTVADFHALHNGEIVNKFGNFVNRTLNYKGLDGYIPSGNVDEKILKNIQIAYKNVGKNIENINFKDALENVMKLVDEGNKYFDEQQPWVLYKDEDKSAFNNVIYNCAYMIANLSILLSPFMPFSAKKLQDLFGIKEVKWELFDYKGGEKLQHFEPLFTRLTDEDK